MSSPHISGEETGEESCLQASVKKTRPAQSTSSCSPGGVCHLPGAMSFSIRMGLKAITQDRDRGRHPRAHLCGCCLHPCSSTLVFLMTLSLDTPVPPCGKVGGGEEAVGGALLSLYIICPVPASLRHGCLGNQ